MSFENRKSSRWFGEMWCSKRKIKGNVRRMMKASALPCCDESAALLLSQGGIQMIGNGYDRRRYVLTFLEFQTFIKCINNLFYFF